MHVWGAIEVVARLFGYDTASSITIWYNTITVPCMSYPYTEHQEKKKGGRSRYYSNMTPSNNSNNNNSNDKKPKSQKKKNEKRKNEKKSKANGGRGVFRAGDS